MTQLAAKEQGYNDVVYLDAKTDTFLEEVSSCNIFTVSGRTIRTPPLSARSHCSRPPLSGAKTRGGIFTAAHLTAAWLFRICNHEHILPALPFSFLQLAMGLLVSVERLQNHEYIPSAGPHFASVTWRSPNQGLACSGLAMQ